MTAAQLEASVYDFIEKLKYDPIPFLGGLVDYSSVKIVIENAMYGPTEWPGLAVLLNAAMTGNLSVLLDPNGAPPALLQWCSGRGPPGHQVRRQVGASDRASGGHAGDRGAVCREQDTR